MSENQKNITILGAGITGLTMAYYLRKANCKVTVLETQDRVGGVIQTEETDGFIYETGPNTGVLGNTETVSLFHDLNLDILTANDKAKKRWILKNAKWQALPSGMLSAVSTPLFTWYDKFRILGEPFRKKGTNPDETLADLVRRRMGKSFLDYAVDPFISGIYAGNPERLITRFALPKLYNLEQNYGSFIKGAIAKSKEPKTDLEKQVTKEVFSVKGGFKNLIQALEREIGTEHIKLTCTNIQVKPSEAKFLVHYNDADGVSQEYVSDLVISIIPSHQLSSVLPFLSQAEVGGLTQLAYAKVIQVVVGYKEWNGIALDAFGGLIPGKEQKDILGILFPSSIFEERAPQKGALLSVFLGGVKKPDLFDLSDDAIKDLVLSEIQKLVGEKTTPDLVKIFRYAHAIPQYEINSEIRLKTIKEVENTYQGLIIAGNIRDGIGMSDRIKQAQNIAQNLISAL